MHILIVTEKPKQISPLRRELKRTSVTSECIKPSEIKDKWLGQFHVIYLHASIDKNKSGKVSVKIREKNWESPLLLHYTPSQKIYKSKVLPENIAISSMIRTIKSVGTKGIKNGPSKIKYRDLTLHVNKRAVERGDRCSKLCYKEFGILEMLMKNEEQVVRRGEIIETMWDRNATITSNTLEVHISNLRKKVDKGFKKKLIHTIPQLGYRLSIE